MKTIKNQWRVKSAVCVVLKNINNFHKKIAGYKDCNSIRILKRYYENKDEISNQRNVYFENNKNTLLQKHNDGYIHFQEIIRYYVELAKIKSIGTKFFKILLGKQPKFS